MQSCDLQPSLFHAPTIPNFHLLKVFLAKEERVLGKKKKVRQREDERKGEGKRGKGLTFLRD